MSTLTVAHPDLEPVIEPVIPGTIQCLHCGYRAVGVGDKRELCFECWQAQEINEQRLNFFTAHAIQVGTLVQHKAGMRGQVVSRCLSQRGRPLEVYCSVKWEGDSTPRSKRRRDAFPQIPASALTIIG